MDSLIKAHFGQVWLPHTLPKEVIEHADKIKTVGLQIAV
jgi:hypothetical protein